MERRGFLQLLGAAVTGVALDAAIPLNRVWSFPKNIIVPHPFDYWQHYEAALAEMDRRIRAVKFEIGDIVSFADWPGHFVVSTLYPAEDKAQLYSAEQRLIIRGVDASKLTPILCGKFISQVSHEVEHISYPSNDRP